MKMKEKERSADKMLSLLEDPATWQAVIANPSQELPRVATKAKEQAHPAYYGDVWVYRLIVGALGLLTLIAAVGGIMLVAGGKTAPDILVALGSAAVGALAGLLAPSPVGRSNSSVD